jgi:hypothetical protein
MPTSAAQEGADPCQPSATDIAHAKAVLKLRAELCNKYMDPAIKELRPNVINQRFDNKFDRYHAVSSDQN